MKRSLIAILSAISLLIAGISTAEAGTSSCRAHGQAMFAAATGGTGSVTLHHIFYELSGQGLDGADPDLLKQGVWKEYETGEIDEIRRDALLKSVSSMHTIGVNPVFGDLAPHYLAAAPARGWRP